MKTYNADLFHADYRRKRRNDIIAVVVVWVLVFGLFIVREAFAGGPQDQWSLPQGGDCYQFSDTPTNEKQKRVMTERGWKRIPMVKKHEIGQKVARGEAEWLLVQDDSICGEPLGEQKVYAGWYWRPR